MSLITTSSRLYGSVRIPDLHSFPTRRSSDLRPPLKIAPFAPERYKVDAVGAPFPWLGEVPVDRKSTRLNSSHANISYAVFCLKKKTRRARRPAPRAGSIVLAAAMAGLSIFSG